MGPEVQLIEWDSDVEHAARLVRKHTVLGKDLPLYICAARAVFKRLFDSKLYVRL